MKPQHKLFAEKFMISNNRTQAAIDAGYSTKSARNQGMRLMKKDAVLAYIETLRQPIKDKNLSTVEGILLTLQEQIKRCMVQVPVTDKLGKQVFIENAEGELVPVLVNIDSAAANKALELLGKTLGAFDPDRKLKEDKPQWVGLQIVIGSETLSPEEHENLLEFRRLNEMKSAA